jgi:PadR family transcriptional regulator, regulatory protein AphA
MSLEHAILGFLNYKPLSGYDLKAVFDLSVQHFWPADQSQIYRTLAKLEDSGLTDVEIIEQDDRPDKKVYHITGSGREELHRWLTTPLPLKKDRIAELIQVFFAGQLSDEEILPLFQRYADHCRMVLDVLRLVPQQAEAHFEDDGTPKRDSFFWALTLEYGMCMTEMSLAWFEDVVARIERKEHTKGE